MDERELRKLGRTELLEMLITQSHELQECREKLTASDEKLKAAQTALENREIAINRAGSIAEAALMLNGVFEASQMACQQYTDNRRQLNERQSALCAERDAESSAKAERLIAEAERRSEALEREARQRSDEMLRKAREESQRYWDDVVAKLDAFCDAHAGLRELLAVLGSPHKQQ